MMRGAPVRDAADAVRAAVGRALYLGLHDAADIPVRRVSREIEAECRTLDASEIVMRRLRTILLHCRQHVPYYQPLLPDAASINADPMAVLRQLPVLTKETLREDPERLMRTDDGNRRRWYVNTSGGSTGEPVRFMQDNQVSAYVGVTERRYHESLGRRLGERAVFLWGSKREVLEGSDSLKGRVLTALRNDEVVNAYQLTEATIRRFLQRIDERPPALIVGYCQSVYETARFAERHGLRVRPQRAIITTAGTLYDFMRDTIERVFGCEVFDQYGSREVGPIALECAHHTGLHVSPWANHVEVLDSRGAPAAPGGTGDIVVTSLTNFAMPLLRYAIGDRGRLAEDRPCPCGRSGTRLASIAGRTVDTWRTADGTLVDGGYFSELMWYRQWVKQFQAVQLDVRHVVFRVIPSDRRAPDDEFEAIRAAVRKVLGADCRVDLEYVSDLPPSQSGKYRFTLSMLDPEPRADDAPAAPGRRPPAG